MRRLRDIVLGMSLAIGLGGCASLQAPVQTNPNFKTYQGVVDGYIAEYHKGVVNGKDVCSAGWEDENGWYSLGDPGCDDIVDAYREGGGKGATLDMKREDDEETFRSVFDPKAKKIREEVYERQVKPKAAKSDAVGD